jgi:DNA-binding MarR family transcriptional regulator
MENRPGERRDAAGAPAEGDSAPRIPTERYELKVLQALRKIIRGIDIHSKKLVSSHDITAPQLICLITIVEGGALALKHVAERVYLSPSTVVGIIDRLESKGLVLRSRDTRDRRLVNVTATAAGRELVKNAPSPLQDSLARALVDLPEIEQATIALALQRIVDLMEVDSLEAGPLLGSSSADENASQAGAQGGGEETSTEREDKGVA